MDYFSSEAPLHTTLPTVKNPGNALRSPVRRNISTFVCDGTNCGAAAVGALLHLGQVPKGARGVRHTITTSASLATSTLTLGILGNATKYAAAATYTGVNAPVTIRHAANLSAELAADEDQYLTVGVAALPNDGTIIVVETEYTLN